MNEELIRQCVADAINPDDYPEKGGYRTAQDDAAFAIRLYHARAVAALVEAAQQILLHAGIADAAPEDIDGEDHEREASLRLCRCHPPPSRQRPPYGVLPSHPCFGLQEGGMTESTEAAQ